jgi:hypothetical protein
LSELKIMNHKIVRQKTGWDSPSANAVQYFSAAFTARLVISQNIEPPERGLEFMRLGFCADATSMAAFRHYMLCLGATFEKGSITVTLPETNKPKQRWFSRVFKNS